MTDTTARMDDFGEFLTLRELAQVLRCSVCTIKRRLRGGTFPIPPICGIHGEPCFARDAVVRYLESGGA